jgi:hypothetical protein
VTDNVAAGSGNCGEAFGGGIFNDGVLDGQKVTVANNSAVAGQCATDSAKPYSRTSEVRARTVCAGHNRRSRVRHARAGASE